MSVPFLSPEWLDLHVERARRCPPRPGASARVQHVVTGGPDGDVSFFTVVEDGHVVEARFGTDGDADVTVTRTYADAVATLRGELDAAAAFMQGRTKVVGSMGRFLAVLAIDRSEAHQEARADVAAATDA